MQELLDPLVVSWGWGENSPFEGDTRFLQEMEWWGTKDPAPYLSVPSAIQFQEDQDWKSVRDRCQTMLTYVINEIESMTGLPSIYGENREKFIQIAAAEIPENWQPGSLQEWLYQEHKIEVPVIDWESRWFIRPSIQGYNSKEDIKVFLNAIKDYLGILGKKQ